MKTDLRISILALLTRTAFRRRNHKTLASCTSERREHAAESEGFHCQGHYRRQLLSACDEKKEEKNL